MIRLFYVFVDVDQFLLVLEFTVFIECSLIALFGLLFADSKALVRGFDLCTPGIASIADLVYIDGLEFSNIQKRYFILTSLLVLLTMIDIYMMGMRASLLFFYQLFQLLL